MNSHLEPFLEPTLVLDHGFVQLVGVLGDDASVVADARVSYAKGTKTVRDDRNLLHYLLRHGHVSPLEQQFIKLRVRLPIFVMRQWAKHNFGHKTNEISGRYSELDMEAYVPDPVRKQGKGNKQGSAGAADGPSRTLLGLAYEESFGAYAQSLARGDAREIARCVTPVATYTEVIMSGNLRDVLFFLKARLDSHAQWEIRQYAQVVADIVKAWVPETYAAFEDYYLGAVTFSRKEVEALRVLAQEGLQALNEGVAQPSDIVAADYTGDMPPRMAADFLHKLGAS